MKRLKLLGVTASALTVLFGAPTWGQTMEKVKVAASWVGLWDTSQPTFCKTRDEFKKAGLDVDIVSTRGGSETVQAVTTGNSDIAYSPGINAVLAAYITGAKIKIISSQFVGGNDTFWYVKADSPIKSIADLEGKKVGFPRPGGASEAILVALKKERNLNFSSVATGGMDATFTMVMTKQVDAGYSGAPDGLLQVQKGETRILFSGDDVKSIKDVISRVNIASTDFVTKRRPVLTRFMQTLNSCINWMYANPVEGRKLFSELNKLKDDEIAKQSIAFYSRDALAFAPLKNFDKAMADAVAGKFIEKPLTEAKLKDLIDIVALTK